MSEFGAFGDMERSGWFDAARAAGYIELFAAASDNAIGGLLNAVCAKAPLKALDLCSGHGNVSAALCKRGCRVVGVDFSPVMLMHARLQVTHATFIEADAQDLPFNDAEFDIVVSNFGMCHIPDQPRALLEVKRVLRPHGRFAMTVWGGPEISPCFDAVYRAVQAHGSPHVLAPPGPDFHQFAKRDKAEALLLDAGFSNVDLSIVDCAWELDAPERLFEIFEKGTVRAAAILANQPLDSLAVIRHSLTQTVKDRFAHGDRWRVPVPAALLRATA